jgi:hypothetical protein
MIKVYDKNGNVLCHEPPYTQAEEDDLYRRMGNGPVAFTRPDAVKMDAKGTQDSFPTGRIYQAGNTLHEKADVEQMPEAWTYQWHVTIKKKAFLSYAVGSITNTTERRFSYLTVKLNLFDGNGKFVGSTSDAVQNCEPNQVWNFEAGILEGEATSVVVSDIKGWLV